MKKTALIMAMLCTFANGDIQAPPGSEYTSARKLSRGISNVLFGIVEIPENAFKPNKGLIIGADRFLQRASYGFYDLITFRCPTFHGTVKQPYIKCGQDNRIEMDPASGLEEFPQILNN